MQNKNDFKILVLFVLIFIITNRMLFAQTNYYVANNGDDGNDGLSPSAPWQTISKVNGRTLSPGDTVFFKKGDVFRAPLVGSIGSIESGTPDNYIVYSAYGTGSRPRILGSVKCTNWTNVSGNIWSSSTNVNDNPWTNSYGSNIYFEDESDTVKYGDYKSYNLSNLVDEYDWTWNNNTIYIYSPTNPATRYNSVEAPLTSNLCTTGGAEYIEFSDLEFAYSILTAIRDPYSSNNFYGLNVLNCYIHHIGKKNSGQAFGLSIKHSLAVIRNNEFEHLGRRAISIHQYEAFTNARADSIIIDRNWFGSGYHTQGIDIGNDGGIGDTISNVYIINNVFESDPNINYNNEPAKNANPLYLVCDTDLNVRNLNFYIYNNIFLYVSGGVTITGCDNLQFHHNTFYGHNNNVTSASNNMIHQTRFGGHRVGSENYFYNNLMYNTKKRSANPYTECVFFKPDGLEQTSDMDFNLYWSADPSQQLLNVYNQSNPSINEVYYVSTSDGKQDITDWTEYTGFDDNSIVVNPMLVDSSSRTLEFEVNKYTTKMLPDIRLQASSQAIDNGTSIPYIKTDLFGIKRSASSPTIGALEYIELGMQAANIKDFVFETQVSNAIINKGKKVVRILVSEETDISNLTPTILISDGAQISPDMGIARNFTEPVEYTVTAQDGVTTKKWTILVSKPSYTEANIEGFELDDQIASAIINDNKKTVKIIVHKGTDITQLTPTITVSNGAEISPSQYSEQDFTSPVIYTVTSYDGEVQEEWTVTVVIDDPTGIGDLAEENTFNIFPNPANDFVTIDISKPFNESFDIYIYNLQGKLIFNRNDIFSKEVSLSTKEFTNGIYLAKIKFKNGFSFHKRFSIVK